MSYQSLAPNLFWPEVHAVVSKFALIIYATHEYFIITAPPQRVDD